MTRPAQRSTAKVEIEPKCAALEADAFTAESMRRSKKSWEVKRAEWLEVCGLGRGPLWWRAGAGRSPGLVCIPWWQANTRNGIGSVLEDT